MLEIDEVFYDNMEDSMLTRVVLLLATRVYDSPSGGLYMKYSHQEVMSSETIFCDKGFVYYRLHNSCGQNSIIYIIVQGLGRR